MNVTWPSRWLEWILVTPRFHQVHHSDDPQHYVANLGDLLTVWDRLFGTYVDPASIRKELTFGIDSNPSTARLVLGV
jgi:sterol desaturase/sphingolipid hydroxylase (fatty acid hydroxylase superfamily)